jgi:hypothetical protein
MRAGVLVLVRLPTGVESWNGAPWWLGRVVGLNGDSADVTSPGGIEPVDRAYVRQVVWKTSLRRAAA